MIIPFSVPEYFRIYDRTTCPESYSINSMLVDWTHLETVGLMDRVYQSLDTFSMIRTRGELLCWTGTESRPEIGKYQHQYQLIDEIRGIYITDHQYFAIELAAFDQTFRPQVRFTASVGDTTCNTMLTPRMKTSLIKHKIGQINDLIALERL